MPHARTITLDTAADPIHVAIQRHCAAILAYLDAPSLITNDDLDAATDALVATPCASRFGALALLKHLNGWLNAAADFADEHQPAYSLAKARAADLTLFLGTNLPPISIPYAFPSGRLPAVPPRALLAIDRYSQSAPAALPNEPLPGEIEPWQAVAAVRPDTAFVRARRFMDAGAELLAALMIIGGGCVLTGFVSLL
ncbi:hypothetical protein MKK68_13070 [Methylobacterium sp. E-016]|uniref:hypothetical protein n=1 Tax=Methylobacterium sp. E-016 TaxID=2836556 RepID=UPI001FBB2F1E|nr:hypothetical protein [Methylobacterium sp. E-016]MCJ2076576.1 hypothetical protein [Methylobacterium sp. E-016]